MNNEFVFVYGVLALVVVLLLVGVIAFGWPWWLFIGLAVLLYFAMALQ